MKDSDLTELFMRFVKQAQQRLCGEARQIQDFAEIMVKVEVEDSKKVSIPHLLINMWNDHSKRWITVESMVAYSATMQMLLEYFSTVSFPPNKRFRILSLGSGPGLYETFLAYYLRMERRVDAVIHCADYASGMTGKHLELLDSGIRIGKTDVAKLKQSVVPITADMSDLASYHGRFDLVICNNSLQWALDWRKAVFEIVKVLSEDGARRLLLFVHPSSMGISLPDHGKRVPISDANPEAISACLQSYGFELNKAVVLEGPPGSGQMGKTFMRTFLSCRLPRKTV